VKVSAVRNASSSSDACLQQAGRGRRYVKGRRTQGATLQNRVVVASGFIPDGLSSLTIPRRTQGATLQNLLRSSDTCCAATEPADWPFVDRAWAQE